MTALRLAVLALATLTSVAGWARQADPAGEIRALRAQSNRAIAARDFDAWRQVFSDDYTILPGSSGAPFGTDAFRRRVAPTLADPTFVTYVRTPSRIAVADQVKRAAETGRWVGTWRSAAGITRVSGVYQAMWVPTPAGWRLRNESFVSLNCAGRRCGEFC